MDGLEFISATIGHVLSWPVLIFAALLIFRPSIKDLLGRMKTFEGLGQSMTFEESLARTEEAVDMALENSEAIPRDTVEQSGSKRTSALSGLEREAASNPSFAIISAWERMQDALRELHSRIFDSSQSRQSGMSVILRNLYSREQIDPGIIESVQNLRSLRNEVAHGFHNPGPGEARTYVQTVESLMTLIDEMPEDSGSNPESS